MTLSSRGSLKSFVFGCGFLLLLFLSSFAADFQFNVPYGPHPNQRLDAYWPKVAGRFPAAVFIHGGSLQAGDKLDVDYGDVWRPFVEAGIACVTINYRLAGDASWPAQVQDCAAAVAWTRRALADRGGDPGRIFVIGHSSGAMLAAVLASDWRWLAAHKLRPNDLAGVVPMGSIMWDEEFDAAMANASAGQLAALFSADSPYRMFGTLETYRDLWPMKHLSAAMPPFLFLVAETEQESPPILRHAKAFCEAARKLGVPAEWRILPNRTHYTAIRMLSDPGDPTFALIRDFIFGRKTT